MKPQSIGIVGGAGPIAGTLLLERILQLSRSLYGCYRDADFPKVFFLNFPFSDMLSPDMNAGQVRQELGDALSQLRKNGAAVLAIACNTLHAFLNEGEDLSDLIHLPQVPASEIPPDEVPLVLGTSTSARVGLHKQFFPCTYPSPSTQMQIDTVIDQILKGEEHPLITQELLKILENQEARTVVLGCTELSIFAHHLSPCNKRIIDPLEIAAKKILERSYGR